MVKAKTPCNLRREFPIMYSRRVFIEVREKNRESEARKKATQQATKEQSMNDVPGEEQGQGPDGWTGEGSSRKAAQKGGSTMMQLASGGNQRTNGLIPNLVSPEGHQFLKANTMDNSRDPVQGRRMLPAGKKREPPTTAASAKASSKSGDAKSTKGGADAGTRGTKCILLVDFLKSHYTVTRLDLDTRDHIFGRGANGWATNLYFDARGLQDTDKVLEVLDRMRAGGFGTILSYVNIPATRQSQANLELDAVDPMDRGHMPAKNPREGCTDLTAVFDKLYSLSVRSIWWLEVEDRQSPRESKPWIE